jgi:hypothetical protein
VIARQKAEPPLPGLGSWRPGTVSRFPAKNSYPWSRVSIAGMDSVQAMVFDQGEGSDILDVLEAEWSAVEPLGIDAQEDFLKGVLGRVSVVAESDRNALDGFLVEKWEFREKGFYKWAEAKDRRRDDRVGDPEVEWVTQEGDADRREYMKMVRERRGLYIGEDSHILDAIVAEGRCGTCGTPWDRVVNVEGKRRPVKIEGGCPHEVCVLGDW